MNAEYSQVWDTLQHKGLVSGLPPTPGQATSPWYILVFMGFAGWVAAVFLFVAVALLLFFDLGLERFFDSPPLLWVLGLLFIGTAFFVLHGAGNEFLRHMALAFSLAGQGFVAWAVFQNGFTLEASLLFTAFQLVLAVRMPDFIHRVFSSCVVALGLLVFIEWPMLNMAMGGVLLALMAWVWLHEFHYSRRAPALRAWGYGGLLGLIVSKSSAFFGLKKSLWSAMPDTLPAYYDWLMPLLEGCAALYIVLSVCQRLNSPLRVRILALCGVAALVAVSADAPGLLVCTMVIVLGQAGSNPLLKGLGIAGLLFYASAFYYQLHVTLMAKAQILLATGLLLLAGRWVMLRLVGHPAEISS